MTYVAMCADDILAWRFMGWFTDAEAAARLRQDCGWSAEKIGRFIQGA